MAASDENPIVNFSVKELFEDIKTSLERLDRKLDNKADRLELINLSHDVDKLRREFTNLQAVVTEVESTHHVETKTKAAVAEWNRWIVPVILAFALLGVAIVQLVKS